MQSPEWPDLPFVAARWKAVGRLTGQPTKIVVHATDNTASAANEASWATRRPDSVSAHYFVDDVATVQAVLTTDTAFGALLHGNQDGIQYELCGRSGQTWSDALLRRAARQMARDMKRHDIPVRRLVGRAVRDRAVRGIAGHVDFTTGWPEDNGTHTDPGANFPWSTLLTYITSYMDGGTTMTDETDLTEQEILQILETGLRGKNETSTVNDHPAGRAMPPAPAPGNFWSRPNAWIVRRLLELEYWIRQAPPAAPIVLTDEQLAALTTAIADEVATQLAAKLYALRFVTQDE